MYGIAGLLTGRTLAGRYLIEAVIGRGGMGAVYRAVDERLSRPVAVKVVGAVTNDPGEHDRLRARFHREARAAAALHHPNVVAVHDFGTDAELDLDFLVMELLVGEDLSSRLMRAGPPPLPVSLSILLQAARGLSAGHRAGMVHRDVKPANLFLEAGDRADDVHVRVLDFGIAQVQSEESTLTHLTTYGRSPFSPAYASPEQLRGDDSVSPASDVFNLAAVGYHLVTGVRPFTSSDPNRMLAELSDAVRLLRDRAPELHAGTHAVLVRALARNPAERFRDAGEMADALAAGEAYASSAAASSAASSPAAAPAPRPSTASGEHTVVDGRTKIYTPATFPRTQGTPLQPQRPAAQTQAGSATMIAPPPVPHPSAQHAPVHHPPQYVQAGMMYGAPYPAQRPGPMRRFFRALWEMTLTTASMALFVGAWALAISGVAEGERERVYLGAAASVLFTPLAVHRLTGSRGRYSFGVVGALLATAAAVRVLGRDADPAIGLAAVFGLQIVACFFMSWLTKRKPRPETYPAS